jgi:predicted esterase
MEHHFKAPRTYRYYTLGDPELADTLIIALHGYGQLAKFFIRKFEDLRNDNVFILAPEGMHRFYLEGTSGRVGASWMTKEDRLNDITDNIEWLSALIESYSKRQFKKVILLGFSQGGATAARLYSEFNGKIDHLIMWASVFPPDLESVNFPSTGRDYFVVGDEDPYFKIDQRKAAIDHYHKLRFNTLIFNGSHVVDLHHLNNILKDISE